MNILALDTSTRFLCIGLEFDGKFFGYKSDFKKRHSEILIPVLKRFLQRARLELEDIDFFCVGRGPGSFTGLRIGMATIKGLNLILRKKVVGLVSLDIIAQNCPPTKSLICPVVDAKRNLVYSSFYKKDYKELRRVSKYLLISVADLSKMISEPVVFLGDGLLLYKDFLKKRLKKEIEFLSEEFWYPVPASLISLAKQRIEKKSFSDPNRISPLYLYPKECQIKPQVT